MARRTRANKSVLTRIRSVLAGLTLSGTVSLDLAAHHLNTSPRTLQRRLSTQGVQFRDLVVETRLGIAGALLRETDLSIQEIAGRLGYSTPGGFARAFGRWAGQTPSAFRKPPTA